MADHDDGGVGARLGHYREWAELVDGPLGNIADGDGEHHARRLCERRHSIHFHVWTADEFATMLSRARDERGLPCETVEIRPNEHEFITVLRRT